MEVEEDWKKYKSDGCGTVKPDIACSRIISIRSVDQVIELCGQVIATSCLTPKYRLDKANTN